ncbi:carbohydrate diacid regulator [Peribacillus deserti]|uniref:Carbohydrate diacid regulator n=1 Tax=Peribacillus deserti TaxID=673318 RepID=A0ABS2QFF1_9BACI|nr:sugar diacid recognition domain-containing protein [Peribacillus deserti]MBM7691529.1 carbohydrate diacid regulator [Peribacillus deserti]
MLTREIAETIVQETSVRLNRNVNIMNDQGIIIASRDSSRLYHIHEGALEVLKTGMSFSIPSNHDGKWKGSQPGINLPIVFQDQTVGVIGITGDPEEMKNFGGLVKMTTELMIKQAFMVTQAEWQQRTKEIIIEELLMGSPSFEQIDRRLSLLSIKFSPPFQTFVIQLKDRSVTNNAIIQRLEETVISTNCIIGFININQIFIAVFGLTDKQTQTQLDSVYNILKNLNLTFRLAYSTSFTTLDKFRQAYEDCNLALKIGDPLQEILPFAEIEAKALIYQIDKYKSERFSNRVLHESIQNFAPTLEAFFDNNLNMQQAADKLFIHRNTLIYRLNKIKQETGYDPRLFKDALTLQMAVWIKERSARNEE